jgi:chromosome segregation protein
LFLKSLDILGFKSFASKTSFAFKPGVTALVGPNGCGKSNVVDAIRWVLGEVNARSLRGEVMDDIIFAGSESQKPLGMAEVGMTIVNDDGLLPIDFSEVNIKRRLYRSGESEFLINNNSVRLKDIQELFADTGIGKASYSVMEQGNIDSLLSNRPEERMYIFEEASGITRYKMRIRDSYRKLTATEENITRLGLVISEVEKEYKNLERQAQKAEEYKALKQEEIRYETLYHYHRVKELTERVEKNTTALQTLTEKRNSLAGAVETLEASIREHVGSVKRIENEIVEIRSGIFKREAEIEALNSKSSHVRDRVSEIESEIEKRRKLLKKAEEGKKALANRIAQNETETESLLSLLQSQTEKHQQYREETARINGRIEENKKKLVTTAMRIEKAGQTLLGLREELKGVVDRLLKEIDGIKERGRADERKKKELIRRIDEAAAALDSALTQHKKKLKDLRFATEKSHVNDLVDMLTGEAEGLRSKLSGLKSDISTVIAMQDELSRTIFGEKSYHSQKECVERNIDLMLAEEDELKKEIVRLNEELREEGKRRDEFVSLTHRLTTDLARNREKKRSLDESVGILKTQLQRSEESLEDIRFDLKKLSERKTGFIKDIGALEKKRSEVEHAKRELNEETKSNNVEIERMVAKIREMESKAARHRAEREKVSGQIEKIDLNNAELRSRIETIQETFNENYGVALELFEPEEPVEIKAVGENRAAVKERIRELGQVNLIAIQEFKDVKKRYEYLVSQREDLLSAKKDVNDLIADTIQYSNERFRECFDKIERNFQSIFKRLFNGGKTQLYLTNGGDIFNTGVEIMACPPGKTLRRRSLLSGGEKGLTAVSLLFAIFMVRPSPFCILDEVDHDLDEENIMRFIKLLKEFTDTTQFIIITHNRRTIEFADVIYGITAEQVGVSKVVSLDLVEHAVE